MKRTFDDKQEARQAVWDRLQSEKLARFPFLPHGRIPNFKGASQAALRLLDLEPFRSAKRIRVNPDAPQRHVRIEALRRGITVFVPTPRLRAGFQKLEPGKIPPGEIEAAASLSRGARFAEEIAVKELPQLDAIVAGSVAVTRDGRRCGKGEGYSDLEYAILRELGHAPVPVATTGHPVQIVESLPSDPNDLPLALIVTPDEVIEVEKPPPAPSGIDWQRLDDADLQAMPVLADLRALKAGRA
jgi:5-formyltetrahydrofolate cyclo-ligase